MIGPSVFSWAVPCSRPPHRKAKSTTMPSSSLKRTAACALILASSGAVSSAFQTPFGTSSASGAGLLRRPTLAPRITGRTPVASSKSSTRPSTPSALHMSSSALTQLRGPKGRPILSEDDVASPPDTKVVQACEQAMRQQQAGGNKNNGAVIASDIAARAGVSLSQARRDLSTIATLTGGDISVSTDGELLYTFPANIRGVMSTNSKRFRALQVWERAWPKLFYGIRVGFGVVLFVSIFAIFSTIFLVFSASGSSTSDRDRDDRRGGYGGGGGGMGYGMNNFMLDLFFPRWGWGYSPYYGYYGRVPYSARYYAGSSILEAEREQQPNLFERIFSYIFGDGDPNYGIENARLRAAAEIIRANGGAVVAEQLAPFVDAPPPDASYVTGEETSTSPVDESFVLPIVTQLGGVPTVTEEGDIVYVFEELQMSAENTLEAAGLQSDASSGDIVAYLNNRGVSTRGAMEKSDLIQLLDKSLTSRSKKDPTDPLQEMEIKFTRNGVGWNLLAGVLGAVNLGGALYLGALLPQLAAQGIRLPSYFGLVQAGYPLLLAYAVLYNVIPVARYLVNKAKNQEIRERNEARRSWSTVLRSMGGKVKRKLGAAKKFRTGMRRLGRSDSVYDTRQDAKQLEAQREEDALKAFDELLRDQNSFQ